MSVYLKSLELGGFKSFAGKQRIDFVNGITGIVGPNGCGKSNVVESIKWVLGEQSAKSLRGDKMEDVIFNGSKGRTPMGMAEVNITFNNETHWLPLDFSEVNIGRRIFRSGEGQYYINKSKVRLKDTVELFLDTGVGRDSYAIFGQGKMDRLLSESPVERRILFEDFAGISKFKFRKEEAERKLAHSQSNLDRVTDVIVELEKEVASLKTQAEDANKYHDLREKLKSLEIRFESLRIHNIQKQIHSRSEKKAVEEEKLRKFGEQLTEYEENMGKTDADIGNREVEYTTKSINLNALEKEYTQLSSSLEHNRDRKISQENWLKNMETRLSQENERLGNLESELIEKETEFEGVSAEKDKVSQKTAKIQEKIDEAFNKIKDLDFEITDQSKELGYNRIISKDDIEKLKQQIVAYQTRLENYRLTLKERFDQLSALKSELAEKTNMLEEETDKRESFKMMLDDVVTSIDDNLRQEKDLKTTSKEHNDEIQNIQKQLKSMDKVIMESLEKQSVEMKTFTERQPMLSARFESALNRLTTAVENNAGIDEVKEIIGEFKGHFENYKKYYDNILGILYSDEGTYTRKENMQSRVEELTAAIFANEKKVDKLRGELHELQSRRQDIQTSYNKADYEANAVKKDISRIENQINTTERQSKEVENLINSHSDEINKNQTHIDKMTSIVQDYEQKILGLRTEKNKYLEQKNTCNVDVVRVEEQYKSVKNEINRIKGQIKDIRRNSESYEQDKQGTLASIEELLEKIEEDTVQIATLETILAEAKEEQNDMRERIAQLKQSRKLMESNVRELNNQLQKSEKAIMEFERGIAERQGSLDVIIENTIASHSIDVREIEVDESLTSDELHKQIRDINREISRLGDVNLLAIEQYQDAKERMEFLSTQRVDIEAAMVDIQGLITETNEKSTDQFLRAFEDIRSAFKKIFARMFEGGRADVTLINPEDPLGSGINIFAEPPGKKFQNISLLSGGERALVTISIIFAILYLKPTPFVILDELDAPLDDDNIERFKSLLVDFREQSQFILVSHSKSTLEICDAIYGVTMEELGVSKVISVAFDEAGALLKDENEEEKNRA